MTSNSGSGSASSNSGGSRKGASATGSKPVSDYSIHKSFGGNQNFYHSYGLKMHDTSNYEEGKAITQAFKDADPQRGSSGSKSYRQSGNESANSKSGGSQKEASATGSKPVSDYSIHESFGGTQNFYHSFGLKMHDTSDYEEGKAITQAFKDADAQRGSSGWE